MEDTLLLEGHEFKENKVFDAFFSLSVKWLIIKGLNWMHTTYNLYYKLYFR